MLLIIGALWGWGEVCIKTQTSEITYYFSTCKCSTLIKYYLKWNQPQTSFLPINTLQIFTYTRTANRNRNGSFSQHLQDQKPQIRLGINTMYPIYWIRITVSILLVKCDFFLQKASFLLVYKDPLCHFINSFQSWFCVMCNRYWPKLLWIWEFPLLCSKASGEKDFIHMIKSNAVKRLLKQIKCNGIIIIKNRCTF